jgi:hypothetical protein
VYPSGLWTGPSSTSTSLSALGDQFKTAQESLDTRFQQLAGTFFVFRNPSTIRVVLNKDLYFRGLYGLLIPDPSDLMLAHSPSPRPFSRFWHLNSRTKHV